MPVCVAMRCTLAGGSSRSASTTPVAVAMRSTRCSSDPRIASSRYFAKSTSPGWAVGCAGASAGGPHSASRTDAREDTPSRLRISATWYLTPSREMPSCSATSRLVSPRGDQAGDFALTIGECVGHVASLWPRGAIRAAGPGAVGQAAIE